MNRAVTEKYLELLTGSAETAMHWRILDDKKERPGLKIYGSLSEIGDELEELNKDGYGIFAVINEGGDVGADITRVRAVFIDLDNKPLPEHWHLKPDFIVSRDETHHHAYWLVDDVPVEEFRTLQTRLIQNYGSDKAIKDLNRVLRTPGFYHHKGDPIMVRLEAEPYTEHWELGHHRAQIEERLPPVVVEATENRAPDNVEIDSAKGIGRALAHLRDHVRKGNVGVNGVDGNNTAYWHAKRLYNDFALSKEKTLDLLAEHFNPYCNPVWPLDELGVITEHASEYHNPAYPRGCGLLGAAETFGSSIPIEPETVSTRPQEKPLYYPYSQREQDEFPDPVWLIPDLLPEGGIGMFYGEPGSYKSFLTLDIALSLSYGVETFGYTIPEPITTVYVAGESAHALGKVRRPAWRISRGIDKDSPFYLVTDMPLAEDNTNFLDLAKALDAAGVKPKLIVVDTMSASLEGLNENDGAAVGKFLGGCRQLKKLYNCTIIIIHHVGKDLTKGARGWSGLKGSVDFAIYVEANDETKAVQCTAKKIRDAELRKKPWTFQGRKLAGALVFTPTTPEQHAELWNNVPKLDGPTVGAALRELKAFDPNRITTHVLAEALTPQNRNHSVEDRKAAVSATKRALNSLAKGPLAGYCTIEEKEVWWFLPTEV